MEFLLGEIENLPAADSSQYYYGYDGHETAQHHEQWMDAFPDPLSLLLASPFEP